MSFKELSLKMIKVNARRYLLYILSSGFAVMVFFLYLTMYTNKDFNDSYKINSMISSNLYAPTLVIGIFSAFFIIYAHNYFIKFRKKDFGLFMIIGMTDNDIRIIMILENTLVAASSILGGLTFGTLFSKIFYFLVQKIIKSDIVFSINLKSYIYSIIFFGLINILIILKSCISVALYKIINLLKSERKADSNLMGKPFFAILGIILIIGSISTQLLMYNKLTTGYVLGSILVFLVGIYLIIANLHWFITKFYKLFKNKYINNLLFINNLKYSIGSSKNIMMSITLLITVIVFFISFSSAATSSLKKCAIIDNPYDMVYAEIFDKNKISEETINNIIKTSQAQVASIKNLEFISDGPVTILSNKLLNNTLGTNLNVNKGKYISLFQIDRNDGYRHDDEEFKSYNINNNTYTSQGRLEKILFNNVLMLNGSHYLIFNDDDYIKIKASFKPSRIGNLKLINFVDWRKTEEVVNKLTDELIVYNKTNTKEFFDNEKKEIRAFKPTSKIEDYRLGEKAGVFSLFLFVFIFVLFSISSNVMIHLKLLTEYDKEKVKYWKLFKIGITEKEISKNISKELKVLFFFPCVLGVIIGSYYIFYTLFIYNINEYGIKYSLVAGLVYIALELVYYSVYRKLYVKRILSA